MREEKPASLTDRDRCNRTAVECRPLLTAKPLLVKSTVDAGSATRSAETWPLKYLEKGETKAVLGGWDPSARKFFKTDELSFVVPYQMFGQMLERFGESCFYTTTYIGRAKRRKPIAIRF